MQDIIKDRNWFIQILQVKKIIELILHRSKVESNLVKMMIATSIILGTPIHIKMKKLNKNISNKGDQNIVKMLLKLEFLMGLTQIIQLEYMQMECLICTILAMLRS